MMRTAVIAVFLFALAGAVHAADAAKSSKAAKGPKIPVLEKLSCRTGPNDHQARLIVEVVKGRPMEFAFYSRLGTRVCSVHGRRGDTYSKWEDEADGKTAIKLYVGSADIEYKPGYIKLKLADVGRMHYCGMEGMLNGVVEVLPKKSECGVEGVFDTGVDE
jgi:hypothetical protein